jgi:hypothetical protein
MVSDSIAWQKEHFTRPYEMFDIRAVDQKQKELGRVLTESEFETYVFGYRKFGKDKGFVPK